MIRIALEFLGFTLLFAAILVALEMAFGFGSSAQGIVGSMVAAMLSGQRYAVRKGANHSAGFAWKAAGVLTLVSCIMGLPLLIFVPEMRAVLTNPEIGPIVIGVTIFVLLMTFLLIRLGFGLGVRNGMKQQEKAAEEVF